MHSMQWDKVLGMILAKAQEMGSVSGYPTNKLYNMKHDEWISA